MKKSFKYLVIISFICKIDAMDRDFIRHEQPMQNTGVELLLTQWQNAETQLSQARTALRDKFERREISPATYDRLMLQNFNILLFSYTRNNCRQYWKDR